MSLREKLNFKFIVEPNATVGLNTANQKQGHGIERICQGIYLEGLCADATSVWVSDPIQGGIRHIRADGTTQAWLPEKRWVGGLLLNANGAVLISGEGGIIWLDGVTGAMGILIDKG